MLEIITIVGSGTIMINFAKIVPTTPNKLPTTRYENSIRFSWVFDISLFVPKVFTSQRFFFKIKKWIKFDSVMDLAYTIVRM